MIFECELFIKNYSQDFNIISFLYSCRSNLILVKCNSFLYEKIIYFVLSALIQIRFDVSMNRWYLLNNFTHYRYSFEFFKFCWRNKWSYLNVQSFLSILLIYIFQFLKWLDSYDCIILTYSFLWLQYIITFIIMIAVYYHIHYYDCSTLSYSFYDCSILSYSSNDPRFVSLWQQMQSYPVPNIFLLSRIMS